MNQFVVIVFIDWILSPQIVSKFPNINIVHSPTNTRQVGMRYPRTLPMFAHYPVLHEVFRQVHGDTQVPIISNVNPARDFRLRLTNVTLHRRILHEEVPE